jgi:hypothetical protein
MKTVRTCHQRLALDLIKMTFIHSPFCLIPSALRASFLPGPDTKPTVVNKVAMDLLARAHRLDSGQSLGRYIQVTGGRCRPAHYGRNRLYT